ncbi:MAG TPA: META domain-containing protein [Candidatus Binatia bacterium]|nr:META domain-containing protein [Candidatus Binatia bacterium]
MVAVLASCTSGGSPATLGPSSSSPAPSTDAGSSGDTDTGRTTWVLASGTIDGRSIPLLPDRPITLVLTVQQLSGVSACNAYWADLERSDGAVRLTHIVATTMDCRDEAVMAADEAYLAAVPRVTRLDDSRHDELVLEGSGVRLVFRPAPLEEQGG